MQAISHLFCDSVCLERERGFTVKADRVEVWWILSQSQADFAVICMEENLRGKVGKGTEEEIRDIVIGYNFE